MKSIYGYQNFREYLRDFYSDKKRKDPFFSYKAFSEAAGLKSPNYLALIIDGDRNLTTSNIHQFSNALQFRTDEIDFFEALVLFNQSKMPAEQLYYKKRLTELKKRKPASMQKSAPGDFLKDWFSPGMMVLAHNRTFEEAITKCKSQLSVSEKTVRKGLDTLTANGLLASEDGVLKINSQQMTFYDSKSLNHYQEKYLGAQLERSLLAFHLGYRTKRAKFLSHSLTIPRGSLPEIQEELASFVEDLTEKMDRQILKDQDELVQINIQTFHPRFSI